MDVGVIVTFAGIVVAGLAGVLGVWMERNPSSPSRWAWVFSGLILAAMGVETSHSIAQATEDGETQEAMARVLERLSELAAKGDNPALEQFVGAELAVQARSNPQVMKKLERNVAAKGGDPKALQRKAAASRRTAAGLPPRAPDAKAGKAGKAGKAAAGAVKLPGSKVPPAEGAGKAKTKAKAKAGADGVVVDPSAVVPGGGVVPVPGVPGAAKAGKNGALPVPVPIPIPVPAIPGLNAPAKSKAEGKAGKNP